MALLYYSYYQKEGKSCLLLLW